jgi:hypothetical protein
MAQDPDFDTGAPDEPSEYDAGFTRSGFIIIEEGLDAEGEHAYRFKHTIPRPQALGLLQIISDHLRWREARDWARADEEQRPDDYDGEEDGYV